MCIVEAITKGNLEDVTTILKDDSAQVFKNTSEGETLLQLAFRLHQFRIARILIRYGAPCEPLDDTVCCAIQASVASIRIPSTGKPCSKEAALAGVGALEYFMNKCKTPKEDGLSILLSAVKELNLPKPPSRKTIFDLQRIVSVLHDNHAVLTEELFREFDDMGLDYSFFPFYKQALDRTDHN